MEIEKKDYIAGEDICRILDGMNSYEFGVRKWDGRPFVILIKELGETIGGAQCESVWDWMHVRLLWVDQEKNRSGLGTKLMSEIEAEATKRGCLGVHLDTFEFQAPVFYGKLGYEVFGQIEDHPAGYTRYYMKKRLN